MTVPIKLDIPDLPAIRRRRSDFEAKPDGKPMLSIVSGSDPGAEERQAADEVRHRALAGVSSPVIKYDLAEAQTLLRRLWGSYAKCYSSTRVLERIAQDAILRHVNASAGATRSEIEQARSWMDTSVANATVARDGLEKVRGHVESVSREVTRLGVLAAIANALGEAVPRDVEADIRVREQTTIDTDAAENPHDIAEAEAELRSLWDSYAKCYCAKKFIERDLQDATWRHANASALAPKGATEEARAKMEEFVRDASTVADQLDSLRDDVEAASNRVSRLGVLAAITASHTESAPTEAAKDITNLILLL